MGTQKWRRFSVESHCTKEIIINVDIDNKREINFGNVFLCKDDIEIKIEIGG